MPSIDSFNTRQTPTSTQWVFSDAWIPVGGHFLYVEFYNNREISTNRWLLRDTPNIQTDDSTELRMTPKYITTENDGSIDESRIVCVYKLSRQVKRSETITITNFDIGFFAQNLSEGTAISTESTVNVRNYSNIAASGQVEYPQRIGASPNTKKTAPSTDPNLAFAFTTDSIVTDNDAGRANAKWVGTGDNLITDDRSFTRAIGNDATANGLNANRFSAVSFNYLENTFFSPCTDSFTILFHGASLQRPVGNISNIEFGYGTDRFDFERILFFEYNETGRVTVEIDTVGVDVYSRGYPDINTGGAANSYSTGPLGIRWNHLNATYDIFTFNGHKIASKTVTIPKNVEQVGDLKFGIKINQTRYSMHELYGISAAISDEKIQEYCAYLDDRFQNRSKTIRVNPNMGSDSDVEQTSDYRTLEFAMQNVHIGRGDRILFDSGTTAAISDENGYWITSASFEDKKSIGYSPDYPFVIGSDSDVSTNSKPITSFSNDCKYFVRSELDTALMAIHNHRFVSEERDPSDASYVGFASIAFGPATTGEGFGICYRGESSRIKQPDSVQIVDCEIANTTRHAVSLTQKGPQAASQLKYSGLYNCIIHDCWNPHSYKNTQFEPFTVTPNYGIAGIYTEGLHSLCVDGLLTFRVGWQPDVEIGGVSGAIYDSTDLTLASVGISESFYFFEGWVSGASDFSDIQRIRIDNINGSPSGDTSVTLSSIAGITATINSAIPTASNNDVIDFTILDGAPRNSGLADIVFNGIPNTKNDTGVLYESYGFYTVYNHISIESGGHTVISGGPFASNTFVVDSNQFGMLLPANNSSYAEFGFFGSTYGTDFVRKLPESQFDQPVVGRTDVPVYDSSQYGWFITYPKTLQIPYSEITRCIFNGQEQTGFIGSENVDSDDPTGNIYPSACIAFDGLELSERESGKDGPITTSSGSVRARFSKNTFRNMPGSFILVGTAGPGYDITVERNIYDQEVAFASAGELLYNYKHPFIEDLTTEVPSFSLQPYNIFNRFDSNLIDSLAIVNIETDDTRTFNQWKTLAADPIEWATVAYEDAGIRNVQTYNFASLGNSTSAVNFATNAIGAFSTGWQSSYSAISVFDYITAGYKPTNLFITNYEDDFIGAVAFTATSAVEAPTFGIYYTGRTQLLGFGRGF